VQHTKDEMVHKEEPGYPNADEGKKSHMKQTSDSHVDMKEKEN